MDFSYKKSDNQVLFKSLEENPDFGILEPQNYIPLYDNFFSLSTANYNNIILNHQWRLNKVISQETNNIFKCSIKDDKNKVNKSAYLKFSPLLDPLKYLMGKYDVNDVNLFKLPSLGNTECNYKLRDCNNSAYVDSFFSFLSSKLLNEHNFVHGLDFYGSFLSIKNDFRFNIIDDIEMLNESAFFRRNDKVLYELEDVTYDDANDDTRNYKKKLNLNDDSKVILNLSDITDITQLDTICSNEIDSEMVPVNLDMDTSIQNKSQSSHTSSCSSRSSNTTAEDIDEMDVDMKEDLPEIETLDLVDKDDEEGEGEEGDKMSHDSSETGEDESIYDEDEVLIAKIKKFPVQAIALEKCENTLDHLMSNGNITTEMWDSIVLQVLFSLITFQKTFSLTHNDLHTNNIMYCETDKKYLYYKLNHIYYKVPTFGKLFKIIDFGRAIYKFRGQLLCSDSYHPEGDAATQYNCEPYFNEKKPRLEPNMSFDLCRLGCALYDYLIDEPQTKIVQIMLNWILDDKGRNILYKKNGDERYPDFKLYKMIARTVNKHIPIDVLSNAYFDKFIISKKDVKSTVKVMELDEIPCYV
jgi:hypothetical protein